MILVTLQEVMHTSYEWLEVAEIVSTGGKYVQILATRSNLAYVFNLFKPRIILFFFKLALFLNWSRDRLLESTSIMHCGLQIVYVF